MVRNVVRNRVGFAAASNTIGSQASGRNNCGNDYLRVPLVSSNECQRVAVSAATAVPPPSPQGSKPRTTDEDGSSPEGADRDRIDVLIEFEHIGSAMKNNSCDEPLRLFSLKPSQVPGVVPFR